MEQKQVVARKAAVIEVDGLKFKDLNGDGQLNPYEDWRLSAEERAADLVSRMDNSEKAGLFVLHDQQMGLSTEEGEPTSHDGVISEVDKPGLRPGSHIHPTSKMLNDFKIRHLILREDVEPEKIVTWVNTVQEMAEETRLGIPAVILSNSRNENLEAAFNADTQSGFMTKFPGTLGLAAAADLNTIQEFAEIGHEEFFLNNIRKGYMYMVDTATDPRWFRTSGTFGENPDQISDIARILIREYQGEELDENGIAMTIKHFPGGAARENGFDPHYEEGKLNVYATEGSLEKYHLPPFAASIEENPASIMPYYAIPANDKSHTPQAPFTEDFEEEIAFAYNKQFIQGLLIDEMGFNGYVNSDTGVLGSMAWGAEELTLPERAAKVIEAGTNIVSGTTDVDAFQEAFDQGLVSEELVNKRLVGTLKSMFQLGLFDNPYQDADAATKATNTAEKRAKAYEAHQKSVVLLKNENNTLPLTADKLAGKKVYVDLLTKVYNEEEMAGRNRQGIFGNTDEVLASLPNHIKENFDGFELVEDYHDADIAIMFLEPISGSYFEATPTYLDLEIHSETNVDMDKVRAVREAVDTLIINVNFDLPFIVDGVEELADAMTASFDTFIQAILDVIVGNYKPTGKLPITLPANTDAVAVDENGICVSPNDVPGYDKEQYMDIPYAYTDAANNRYVYGFGLEDY